MELHIYFKKSCLTDLLNAMQAGPEIMRPRYFGLLDVVDDKANRVDDARRFRAFLEPRLNASFALFADGVQYDIMLAGNGPARLFAFNSYPPGPTPDAIEHFFRLVAQVDPPFAVACDGEEFEHRNRIVHRVPPMTSGDWLGRDIRICLPGLYWWTMISPKLLKAHNIELSQISPHALSVERYGNLHFLKFFEAAPDWEAHANRLDDVCDSTPGIFSARPVYASVQRAKTMRQLREILVEWHRKELHGEQKYIG